MRMRNAAMLRKGTVALWLSVLLIVLSAFITVSADDSAAIAEIKAAWEDMDVTDTIISPYRSTNNEVLFEQTANSDLYTNGDLGVDVVLGNSGSNNAIFYDENGNNGLFELAPYEDAWFTYEVSGSIPVDTTLSVFVIASSNANGDSPSSKSSSLPLAASGTVSLKDILGENWKSNAIFQNRSYIRLLLRTNKTDTVSIRLNSFVAKRKATLPQDSDNWSLDEWIAAAEGLTLSNFRNTEPLVNAISNAKPGGGYDYAANLRSAWSEVQSAETVAYPIKLGSDPIALEASQSPEQGSYTATADFAFYENIRWTLNLGMNEQNFDVWGTLAGKNYDDVYISFKINSLKTDGSLIFKARCLDADGNTVSGTDTDEFSYEHTISEVTDGFVMLSFGEMFGQAWSEYFNQAVELRFFVEAGNGIEVNMTLGSIIGAYNRDISEAEAGFNDNLLPTYWLGAAKADYNDAALINKEEFNSCFEELNNIVDTGDLGGDGKVNVKDLVRIKRVKSDITNEYNELAADVNLNGIALEIEDILALRDTVI